MVDSRGIGNGLVAIALGLSLLVGLLANLPVAVAIEPGLDRAPDKFAAKVTGDDTVVTIVAVGDTGFNGHMREVRADGVMKHGSLLSWDHVTAKIRADIDGDLNFMNLETIVTARNNLRRENKLFNFRMHPAGVRHLVDIGFNFFSTANNHSMDFGAAGALDTLRHLEPLEQHGLLAYPGIGINREEASRPWPIDIKGARVMVSALGITTRGFARHRAGRKNPGQMSYHSSEDFGRVTRRLSQALAAYRVLSIHYGAERSVTPQRSEIAKLRGLALEQAGIDLVIGHHAHVARAVEITDGKVILYGLGNFLHHGTANMGRFGLCRDYGLMVKLHLRKMADGRLHVRAIEAIPVTGMNRQTERMSGEKARQRIYALNHLARGVDDAASGAKGVRFTPQDDGSGLFCVAGSGDDPGIIGRLCKEWQPAIAPPRGLASRIRSSCGRSYAHTLASRGKGSRSKRRTRRKKSKKSSFKSVFGF